MNILSSIYSNNTISDDIPLPSNDNEPEPITVTYEQDLDLLLIHKIVGTHFSSKLGKIDSMKKSIISLRHKLNSKKYSRVEAKEILDKIDEYENDINMYTSGTLWRQYINAAK